MIFMHFLPIRLSMYEKADAASIDQAPARCHDTAVYLLIHPCLPASMTTTYSWFGGAGEAVIGEWPVSGRGQWLFRPSKSRPRHQLGCLKLAGSFRSLATPGRLLLAPLRTVKGKGQTAWYTPSSGCQTFPQPNHPPSLRQIVRFGRRVPMLNSDFSI